MVDEHVQDGQNGEGDASEVGSCTPGQARPALVAAVDHAPQPHAGEAGGHRQQQVHDQHGRHERAARGRGEEACARRTVTKLCTRAC